MYVCTYVRMYVCIYIQVRRLKSDSLWSTCHARNITFSHNFVFRASTRSPTKPCWRWQGSRRSLVRSSRRARETQFLTSARGWQKDPSITAQALPALSLVVVPRPLRTWTPGMPRLFPECPKRVLRVISSGRLLRLMSY